MRGLSAGNVATQSGGSINGFPNVAIYLDEQSGQLPGRNLDVYAADLERIEVLEAPAPNSVPWGECFRSEEDTSELQSRQYLVCRLVVEKKRPGGGRREQIRQTSEQ